MSLATCCTACGTVFRVVQDQLKVSEGWVRCGRCDEVFNALEGLFDLERDAPPEPSGPVPLAPPGGEPAPFSDSLGPASKPHARPKADPFPNFEPGEERHDPSLVERLGAELFPDRVAERGAATSSRFTALEPFDVKDSRIDAESLIDPVPLTRPPLDSELPSEDSRPLRHDTSAAPEFLRRADHGARWQRPGVRWLLALLALGLSAALLLHAGHHFRDSIAARWPAALPLLARWCGLAKCSLGPLRRIDDIAVESTTFARASAPDQFRVAVVLRNRGALALAVPSVDLSLTDAAGSLLVRKALSPQDFRVASAVIEPGGETQLQLVLAAGTPLVTGYTVEIFYP